MSSWDIVHAGSREEIPSGVLESWIALYSRGAWSGCIPNNLVDAVMGETFRQLFSRGDALMHIAVNPDDHDHWLGYLMTETTSDKRPVVHAALTKPLYRRSGVQRSLFAAAGIDRTGSLLYTMRVGREPKFLPGGRFAPEVARRRAA